MQDWALTCNAGQGDASRTRADERNRTVDFLLTMSIPGRDSTAAMLVRAGFAVVLVPVNVPGVCPGLAREWHGLAVLVP
jgi:hypothetical protein